MKHRWLKSICIFLILGASSITFFKHISSQLTNHDLITLEDIEIANQLRTSDTVLVCPVGPRASLFFDSSFLSYFSDAKMVLIDPLMLEVIGKSGDMRAKQLRDELRSSDINHFVYSQPNAVISMLLCDAEQLQYKSNTIGVKRYSKDGMLIVSIHNDCRVQNQCQAF